METITQLANISTAVISIASFISALTPTPKDDIMIGKLYKFLDVLAINIGKAKQ